MTKNTLRKLVCLVLALLLTISCASAAPDLTDHNRSLTKNLENISEQLRAEIAGLEAEKETAQNSGTMAQTAEEAWEETNTLLNRIVEIGFQGDWWYMGPTGWQFIERKNTGDVQDDSSLAIGCPGSDGSEMVVLVSRTSAGYDFDQFAFDAAGAGFASDHPQSILVNASGDLALISPGEAVIIGFDSNGQVTNNWWIATDGQEVFALPDAAQKGPVWHSSDESVAAVDPKTGEVTAVSPGRATITAEQDGQVDSVEIRVRTPSGIPLEWVLTNDGVKALENGKIPSSAIVRVKWPAPQTGGGDEEPKTQYYYHEDTGWATVEQMKAHFGHDFGDWIYELESKSE